jgi:3-oxoacyl-[acyl-carrier protein] reductase
MIHTEPDVDSLRRDPVPLRGRAALVTGVSRRVGIGYAIARRLAALGASVFLQHYAPHDADQPWGADPGGADGVAGGVADALTDNKARVRHLQLDLANADAPGHLVSAAASALGHLDILVCNHARSGGDGPLGDLNAAMLDAHWAVHTRSSNR